MVDPRAASFSDEFRSVREARKAGSSPKRSPVSRQTAKLKAITGTPSGDLLMARHAKVARAGQSGHESAHCPPGCQETENSAGEADQQALCHQLANQRAPRGAQRLADGDFLVASGGPHQEEVRQVGAGDQQGAAHRSQENA